MFVSSGLLNIQTKYNHQNFAIAKLYHVPMKNLLKRKKIAIVLCSLTTCMGILSSLLSRTCVLFIYIS